MTPEQQNDIAHCAVCEREVAPPYVMIYVDSDKQKGERYICPDCLEQIDGERSHSND